ncbi:MAG: tetratricopeptide repeat protein [Chloroflexi bacterium]|nr:tetratricopeptide repeat protein [Chloroflexota bacterium]
MAPISLSTYLAQARSDIQNGNLEEAREIIEHLATLYPQHLKLHVLRGELALAQEDFTAATEHYERVVDLDPENATAHLALASLIEEDDVLAAIGHLERARELDIGNQEISRNLARLYTLRDGEEPKEMGLTKAMFARMLVEGREYARAEEELRTLLAQDPERTDLQILLARALFFLGRSWEAASICEKILAALPNSLPALIILGSIHYKNGLPKEAQPLLEQARSLDPENKRAQELLGYETPLALEEIMTPLVGEEILPPPPPVIEELAEEAPLPPAMEEATPLAESPEVTPEPARPVEEYIPSEEKVAEPSPEEPMAKPPLTEEEVGEEMAVSQPPVEPLAEEPLEAEQLKTPLEQALEFFNAHPDDPQARLNLARVYAQHENWVEAIGHYRALFDAGPHAVFQVISDLEQLAAKSEATQLQQLLGDAYLVAGRVPEALAQYQKLLAKSK